MAGKPDLQPHDLRWTYAQLGYDAGISVTQISRLLGHASINTTQRCLNLDLELTVSDFAVLGTGELASLAGLTDFESMETTKKH